MTSSPSTPPSLPPPAVSPDAYDTAYYRESCAGSVEWARSGGADMSGLYPGFLRRAGLRPGEVVLDVGTGRGELLAAAIDLGASRAYGIEYSLAAVELARHTLRVHQVEGRAEVLLCDARKLPLSDGSVDLACLIDVVEHLTPAELHVALTQIHRVLKPGGRVVIHTMPNRLIYTVTYRVLRYASLNRWPSDPRKHLERVMHVNELTRRELKLAVASAGFESEATLGEWIYTDHVPSRAGRRVYHWLAASRALAQLGVGDLWAVGRR
jgi:ubiquinone/menaquinone biosynthesis C-methylase UbiE